MDSKGEESKISYPNIFFMIDSFEEVSHTRPAMSPLGLPVRGAESWPPWGLTCLQTGEGGPDSDPCGSPSSWCWTWGQGGPPSPEPVFSSERHDRASYLPYPSGSKIKRAHGWKDAS